MNAIWIWSSSCRGIWLYPEYASRKLILSKPAVTSTIWSIFGRGILSLGQALFRLVKFMQVRSSPFFFFTTTGLETQRGYMQSMIRSFSNSFSTSLLMALFFSGANFLGFSLTGGKFGSIFKRWQACMGSIPGMSSWDH
ncbi:hypothetical protein TorRG33x02_043520, partial [Trema orientale]